MAIEIDQFRLGKLFENPSTFYELVSSRKGYVSKTEEAFDCELISPGWQALGCIVMYVLVHKEQKAYPIMLSSEDLTELRQSLEQLQIQLNGAALINRGGTGFGFGL
jgi:hypothetical protein